MSIILIPAVKRIRAERSLQIPDLSHRCFFLFLFSYRNGSVTMQTKATIIRLATKKIFLFFSVFIFN